MAKINDTNVFPITAPAVDDILLGTDVSDTSNDANGETVNFDVYDILNVLASAASGAPKIQAQAISTATSSASGSVGSSSRVAVTLSAYSFFPNLSGDNQNNLTLTSGGSADSPRIGLQNSDPDNSSSYSIEWRYINV